MTEQQSIFSPASPKQAMMIKAVSECQITVIGGAAGSGKSYVMQLLPLLFIDDPKTNCIMFRRTTPQVTGQGGIWDTAKGIMNQLPLHNRPRIKEKTNEMIFPFLKEGETKPIEGMRIKFSHMQHVKDKEDHQGLQYTLVGFDEGCQFEWEQLEYLMSRLRSESKYFSRMVISCNPDPDHKIKELISWWLDEDGYPIPERDGVIRYYIRQDGDFVWANTREELDKIYGYDSEGRSKTLSFTFVSATIKDNPPMLKNNPSYLTFLEGLNPIDKAQLLHGNWKVKAAGNNYFKREKVISVNKLPNYLKLARGWDLASQEVTTLNKDCDFTANIKIGKSTDGYYYLIGDFCKSNYDELVQEYGRFRKRTGERDQTIIEQGISDGKDCIIVLPVDPAQAGKVAFEETAKRIISKGLRVRKDPVPSNKSKLARFMPFADAVEAGLVRVYLPSFDTKTLNSFYDEFEKFDGERSGKSETKKDDRVDAVATAFNFLSQTRVVKTVVRNQKINHTLASNYLTRDIKS